VARYLYRVPVFLSVDNPLRRTRARFKARVVPWVVPPERRIDPTVLPRGCVWVEVEAGDAASARLAVLAAVRPGDPRPIRSIHMIHNFRHALKERARV